MRNHGLNPDILEDEQAELPDDQEGGGEVGGAKDDDSEVGSFATSSSEASDDDFDSDWASSVCVCVFCSTVLCDFIYSFMLLKNLNTAASRKILSQW